MTKNIMLPHTDGI